jgi:hypothetical protein
MAAIPDFDFKVGQSYFRGRGYRALIALAIVRLPWRIFIFGGASATVFGLGWLLDFAHRYALR